MTHILIADDEPFIVRSLAFMLRREGYTVTTVDNGKAALEALDQQRFDLAFLDIMMPFHTGFEVLEILRAQYNTLPSPVIFLSAKGMIEDRQRGMDLGASAFLSKPFSPARVIALVGELIGAPHSTVNKSTVNKSTVNKSTVNKSTSQKGSL